MVGYSYDRIQFKVLTFDPVFLHGSNLFQCKAECIHHKGYFPKIQLISLIELDGDNEENKQNEEARIVISSRSAM